MDKFKADALERARAQIAGRIGRLCKNLSPAEFDALLDRMAGIQCKYESVGITSLEKKARVSGERPA